MSNNSNTYSYLPFVSILLVVGIIITALSLSVHYRISMRIEQEKSLELVESQARMVAAISHFDAQFSTEAHPKGATEATLSQLLDTLNQQTNFTRSGEFLLGHKDNNQTLTLDYAPPSITSSHPLSKVSAEAMVRALKGNSGSMLGIDHRGERVLAAYTPLPDLNRGLVTKIDLQELREPFIRAIFIALGVSILVITLGALLFKQIQLLKTYPRKQDFILGSHSGIREYERFLYFIIVMTIMCIAVNLSSAIALYLSSYSRSQEHMLALVSNQARLIDSVTRFDVQFSEHDHPQGAKGATLSQIKDAYGRSPGFGISGEYLVGHRAGDLIEIDIHQRHRELSHSFFAFSSQSVEPMRLALQGSQGVIEVIDHQGNYVLSAYMPLTELGYGLIAKMDLAEVRAPFLEGLKLTSSIAIGIIALASFLLAGITQPFQQCKNTIYIADDSKRTKKKPSLNLLLFTGGLISGIFILDLISPLGIAGGVPYVAVIAMGWWFPQRKHIFMLATLVSLLTFGLYWWAYEVEEWKTLINRSYSLFVIWVTALILNLAKASEIAREQQAHTLKKLSLAVEYSPTGVMITNTNGLIEYVNPKFLDNTGFLVGEVLGRNPNILNSSEAPQADFYDLCRTIKAGKEWRGEIINRKKNGEVYWEDTAIYPILSAKGELQNYVCLKEDVTQRKQAQEALQYKATHDALTGLPSVHLGQDRLTNAIAKAKRDKKKAAVLFIDLDGFKAVNDTFGHTIGDRVLQEVSIRFKQVVREVDTVARIGGDEFIIALGEIHKQADAELVAKKIIQTVCQPFSISEQKIKIGSSIGIAIYPEHGDRSEKLIKCADIAMYAIKNGKKNNYNVFTGSEYDI